MKEAQNGIIEINDVDSETVNAMLHYLYYDKIPESEGLLLQLIVIGDRYNIPGSMEKCAHKLSGMINMNNFNEISLISDKFNLIDLQKGVFKFAKK